MRDKKNQCVSATKKVLPSARTVTIKQDHLLLITETICKQCRHPFLALRVLIHVINSVDEKGQLFINARRLATSLDAHYDTVTKCLKFLRKIDVLIPDK